MKDQAQKPKIPVDSLDCDREPIHIPGSIQPHGVLLVISELDQSVIQASENIESVVGISAAESLGKPLKRLLGEPLALSIQGELGRAPRKESAVFLKTITIETPRNGPQRFHAVAHRNDGAILLELEKGIEEDRGEPSEIDPLYESFTLDLESARSLAELSKTVVDAVRELTGFDRVLIYRFDEDGHGTVIGESNDGRLPILMDHRFPASDIPTQARNLYRINRIRIIPDAEYQPVPLVPRDNPRTGRPLDLTFAALRSVSPIHVQYMRNMETASSMSVSILQGGRLWGLISCHHRTAYHVPFRVRRACDLRARAFSLRLSAMEKLVDFERNIEVRTLQSKLLDVMANRGDFVAALSEYAVDLLALTNAAGAAVVNDGQIHLLGKTPTETQVSCLAAWLFESSASEVETTDSLVAVYPPAASFKDKAAGLIAVAISKLHSSYVMWFRPEWIQSVKWSGDPYKPYQSNNAQSKLELHPRRSFETWKETVHDRSLPWKPIEIEGAAELRNRIVGTVLRNAEQLSAMNAELTRSNKELESFSYSVSHDLRAPLRHIVGYAEMLKEGGDGRFSKTEQRYINTIIESSEYAGKLVDKLLEFSRLGRAELQASPINMNLLVNEIIRDVLRDAKGRVIRWRVDKLPSVPADLMMVRMAVRDLFSNAVKYSRDRDEAVIEVRCREDGDEFVFSVKDNGVGFDMEYKDKLFGVFQRLHRWEQFEGTGIGLANVRRVMERHGGRTWAEGEEGVGATFYFTLPKSRSET